MIDVEKQIGEVMELVQYLMNAQSSSQRIREKKSLESKLRTLLSSAQSGEQAPNVVAGARALCEHAATIQNVNADDYWAIHGEDFKEEARIVIAASQPNGEA